MNKVLKCRAATKRVSNRACIHHQRLVLVTGGWRAAMAVWEYGEQRRHLHVLRCNSSSHNSCWKKRRPVALSGAP